MTAQSGRQTPRVDPYPTHAYAAPSTDKVDCERALDYTPQPTRAYLTWLRLVAFLGFAFLAQRFWPATFLHDGYHGWRHNTAFDDLCTQVEALAPLGHEALLGSLDEEFATSAFKSKAYESLGGAIRIPTECYDDLGPPSEDPRWDIHTEFQKYIESRFPRVHANLRRTKVNTYALVYEWKGTGHGKPLMLAAHMDVVPVNPDTYDDWVHPPYSGYYDGEWIWGRGSCDDKPRVTGILTAVETLLEHGFVPSRTVLLTFGADEECGSTGAIATAEYILDTYGPDSMAMIVDEGQGFADRNGIVFSTPAVAEKGYMDIRMDVLTPGGHSSMPPKHTGIGILADLITELEAHPHQPKLIRGGPYYQSLECRARYDTSFPAPLKRLLQQSQTSNDRLRELEDRLAEFDPTYYALAGTTQAIDLIGGGVKVNALPEAAWAVANHRVADHSSPTEVMDRFTDIAHPVAARHNMSLEAFGAVVGSQGPSWGTIRLSGKKNPLPPSPVTPAVGSGPYALLSGTIRATFETHLRTDDLPKSAIVSPVLDTANTDTRFYWNLTRHIFRYHHRGVADAYNGIHTVNEVIRAEGFLEQIRFFTRLILNADQSDLMD